MDSAYFSFVLEDSVLSMDTSVASVLTAETICEIMKCIADVDMPARVRMGPKSEIFRFFNSGYAHDRNISFFLTLGIPSNMKHVN